MLCCSFVLRVYARRRVDRLGVDPQGGGECYVYVVIYIYIYEALVVLGGRALETNGKARREPLLI